jgi:hypothetical protein
MPSVTATASWQTAAALAVAESWQSRADEVHVTVDTPANGTDNNVPYHTLRGLDSMVFPSGAVVSYRCVPNQFYTTAKISRQPTA